MTLKNIDDKTFIKILIDEYEKIEKKIVLIGKLLSIELISD
jgi:hypothetical protein